MTLPPRAAPTGDHTEEGMLLQHAELLLAAAEPAEEGSGGEHRETARREAISRMLDAAATLRKTVAAQALEVIETATRERARVTAEAEALHGELDVLRAEIAMLRGERDLSLVLTLEASGAVARYLAQWHQWHESVTSGGTAAGAIASGLVPTNTSGSMLAEAAQSIAHHATLASAGIASGASNPTASVTITITALPGLVPLLELEPALAQLPCVQRCSAKTLRRGQASVELALEPPTAPLIVAAEILGLSSRPLTVESIGEQHIAARFASRG